MEIIDQIKNVVGEKLPEQPKPLSPEETNQKTADYVRSIINPMDYKGMFEQAFKGLGQGVNAPPAIVGAGVNQVAEEYVREYLKRTGQMPPAEKVQDFVNNTVTPSYASQVILGTAGRPQITSKVRSMFEENPELAPQPANPNAPQPKTPDDYAKEFIQQQSELYPKLYDVYKNRLEQSFIPQRKNLISNLAVTGRYGSPISAIDFQQQGNTEQQALNELLGNLYKQQANGLSDIFRTSAGIGAGERRAGEQVSQFGKTLGLQKQELSSRENQNFIDSINQAMENERNRVAQRKLIEMQQPDEFDKQLGRVGKVVDIAGKIGGTRTPEGRTGGLF